MNISEFFTKSKRLLIHSKRPDRKEIWLTVRITAIGILIIGLLGFIIHILFTVLIPNPNESANSAVTMIPILKSFIQSIFNI